MSDHGGGLFPTENEENLEKNNDRELPHLRYVKLKQIFHEKHFSALELLESLLLENCYPQILLERETSNTEYFEDQFNPYIMHTFNKKQILVYLLNHKLFHDFLFKM